MRPSRLIHLPQSGIVVCLFILFGYAAVDLVPCDKTRRVFTSSWGVITDGPIGSNYTQDSHCEWLIRALNPSQFITLTFRSMGTECSYDYVFVYDGDSFRSPLLGSFSGKTEPQTIIAHSGHMLVLLYSDTNYVLDGFRAEFSITDCPNNCTNHGVCIKHKCACMDNNWGGMDCSVKLCPADCNRGRCVDGLCVCPPGFSGQSCDLNANDKVGNTWHWLAHAEGGLKPRAAHTAAYIEATDSIYVFGGYNLNQILTSLEIYSFANSTWYDEHFVHLTPPTPQVDPATIDEFIERLDDLDPKWGNIPGTSFLRNLLYAGGTNNNQSAIRRRQRHSKTIDDDKPGGRYGHAACALTAGFVIYGGKLENGSLANDLWFYNVHKRKWQLRAAASIVRPPALTRHTLTVAHNNDVYLFGGSTQDGEFSSRLFRIRLSSDDDEQWEEVKVRGGKELDVRVVAHSAVFHPASNSLLIYGGIVAGIARFSKLSDRMFAFQLDSRHWTEIHYTREHLREKFVPRERAFHTANIFGNYLIVFGGYSHRHNKEEICYDNQMYLYHLGCHTWVNPDILGRANDSGYPKQQGVFAHAATIRNGNTLLLVGGYHGNVNGDLLAYTLPPMIASRTGERYEPEAACQRHRNYGECSADPECGWCSADEVCYGRTIGANCTTNLQTTRCPGICPALGDCHSCLIHGHAKGGGAMGKGVAGGVVVVVGEGGGIVSSASHKLGLGECTWCVQNARCHHKDDNYGVCGLREDSPSQMPGWWGAKGTEVVEAGMCRELDRRPGLTFVKYHHPVNFTQPDHVAIINATTVDFNMDRLGPNAGGEMVARLLGFLRLPPDWQEMLNVCISYCSATLKLSSNLLANVSTEQKDCKSLKWPSLINNETTTMVAVDFESHKISLGAHNNHEQSKMELQHHKDLDDTPKVFTFEYLEPYANGTCAQYKNCLYCLTDSQCGWCDSTAECVSRSLDESISCPIPSSTTSDWRYLTLQPSACSNCSNYISCESCVISNLCQWSIEDAKCSRNVQKAHSATTLDQCPIPCYKRPDCGSCLDQKGRCVWCEATQQCFSFSVYTSEYQFGLCREWLDQAFPLITTQPETGLMQVEPLREEQCKSCSLHTNCSHCLSSLSCGWCFNASNPMTGQCVQGDFNNPRISCGDVLNIVDAKWAYAQCPDVDECHLGLHDCHPQAICTNTDGSYSCHCKKGYTGDGRSNCQRTCSNVCVHGVCQGQPDYICKCDLGWYGDDCSLNCGCNNHSTCTNGPLHCDECQDWTTGDFCEFCKPGSYGNATTAQHCHQCDCNGHGIRSDGECDIDTGVCFCKDNTEGAHCERCAHSYYGDPRHAKQCYYECEARGMLTEPRGQGIGSMQAYSAPWGGPPTRECLWIIKPEMEYGAPIIQLEIGAQQLNVTCGENAVYVYDGLPELVDVYSESSLLAVFCSEEALPVSMVESRTGQLTVHYKQGLAGEGFSGMYKVLTCVDCLPPRRCIREQCVCQEGLVGFNCEELICPKNCSQGVCDKAYGRCICTKGWTGPACDIRVTGTQLVFTELFNTVRLADNLEHLRKTLPRFGHSLASDRRGSLWMFGGYSLSHGPLNDIRLFDTRNSTWTQVTVESTPDAKMPQGRYFHGADIIHSKQAIYVYGGLTRQAKSSNNRTLDDFWQFDIQNQRWGEIDKNGFEWPPPVSSHTLTSYRNATTESLILIGGVSPQAGFLRTVWEFRLDKEQWLSWNTRGRGPLGIYGHSTVFHAQSNSLYVFGGYVYEMKETKLSNKLFMLNYDNKVWAELNALGSNFNLPKPRFFHSAVTTDNYMYLMGGRIHPWNITDTLYAYSYNCNRWINLMSDARSEAVEKVGPLPIQTYAQAMTIEPDGDAAYIVGGWGSDSQCSVLRLELPDDLCSLWPSRNTCLGIPGCGHCAHKEDDDTVLAEICHSNEKQCPLGQAPVKAKQLYNPGKVCNEPIISGNCSTLNDCAICVQSPGCRFCDGFCTSNLTCEVTAISQCSFNKCAASDCIQCHQIGGCDWTEQKCVMSQREKQANEVSTCNQTCMHYTACSDCLDATECHWSTQLDECVSSAHQPAYCAGGVCGLVLQTEDRQYCPEPCASFKQCTNCLRHAHCGWCATPGVGGEGICTEGSNDKPMTGTCADIFLDTSGLDEGDSYDAIMNVSYSWNYVKCPPEDECENGHHSCAKESERCVDLDEGFKCECGTGYKQGAAGCEPVCPLGCVRGQCIHPNNCQCDFGYVGANCSIQCQCNGHANCKGPDKLDECIKCHNNTMGTQCEKCKPYFVGDPSNGGICKPCLEYCHGHTSTCVEGNNTDSEHDEYSNKKFSLKSAKQGPKENAKCLDCANFTTGTTCEECVVGHFRKSENYYDNCTACECNGHGDTCDPINGDKCNCKNNTESDTCGASGKNSAHSCWEVQCSKCKEGYIGTPTGGHQCYKHMSVDSKMCFDAKPIDECKIKPKPLHPGEVVFFMIQPRFMNVNIRIMIDVTQGSLNVYMSTNEDTFIANTTEPGKNMIFLDQNRTNDSQKSREVFLKHNAAGLRTYITVTQLNAILAVMNLRDRLVITLPEEYHKLESTRFFIVLQALDPGAQVEKKVAYGIVFSRQDQLHIDLFVFFSVFFSCFFLFLAACVVAWKAKQAADVRRARRRHVVEMLHMAKRPFASVTLNLNLTRVKPKKSAHWDLRPVAVEPTDDGLAAVATVFVSLPGGQNPCVRLALASSLILLARQCPSGGRTFLRRRSAHAPPPT